METVSVIGDGTAPPESELYRVAVKVGRLIAEKGYALVTGGLFGVMEGASKGAKEAGGLVVGILPHYEELSNPFIDIKIPTGLGHARNVIVVSTSRTVVAIGGGYGTLSEIGHALKMGKRVLGYKTWGVKGIENYESLDDFLNALSNAI
ncbi:TIGR00725 family protein [Thermovibrio ammonificans]